MTPRWAPFGTLVAITGTVILVGACSAPGSSATNTVNALWYGKQKDGSIAQGVTKVTIETTSTNQSGFKVDLTGFESANAGAYWNSAAWSAAVVAALSSMTDPRDLQIKFGVEEEIDGPSAGGLLATGVMADLADSSLIPGKTMTGTILPNGGIGPVGGIPAKLRAAKEAGITEVLIPQGQKMSTDPVTGKKVNVVDQGQQLGIKVTEIASVTEAKDLLTGVTQQRAQADTGPIDDPLLAVVKKAAATALADTARTPLASSVIPSLKQGRSSVATQVDAYVRDSKAALSANDPISALTNAAAAARLRRSWNGRAVTVTRATNVGSQRATDELLATAKSLAAQIQGWITDGSQTPVQTQEQTVSLADALSWGTDALARTTAVVNRLGQAAATATPALLGKESADLAEAKYDGDSMLPVAIESLTVTGKVPVSNVGATTAFLGSYAEFLSDAADANGRYFEQIAKDAAGKSQANEASKDDLQVVAAGRARWEVVKSGSSGPEVAVKLSQAISRYVDSMVLIASYGAVGAAADDAAISRIEILNGDSLKAQRALASVTTEALSRSMAADGLDSSYPRWSDRWGAGLTSTASGSTAADEAVLRGLVYQWFANLQEAITLALHRAVP